MVNKENYYPKYTLYAKYQIISAKAVVQVDFHLQKQSAKIPTFKTL